MDLRLERLVDTGACTLGWLHLPNGSHLHTLERPWQNNDPAGDGDDLISCVPAGRYVLEPHPSRQFGKTWALVNPRLNVVHWASEIPKGARDNWRATCLIHNGNWVRDVVGCIALGLSRRMQSEHGPMVTESGAAMRLFRELLGPMTRGHTLTIEGTTK